MENIKIIKILLKLLITNKTISSVGLLYFCLLFNNLKEVNPFRKKYHWIYKNVNGIYKSTKERIK